MSHCPDGGLTVWPRIIESYFQDFLRHRVEHSSSPMVVTYIPALRNSGKVMNFSSPDAQLVPSEASRLEIKVLTPAFYSRLVHYVDFREALIAEALSPPEENHTLDTSDLSVLTTLLDQPLKSAISKSDSTSDPRRASKCWKWSLLSAVRPLPPAQSYPSGASPVKQMARGEACRRALSPLDNFVSSTGSAAYAHRYRQTLIELFLSEYIAFGSCSLLHGYGVLLQIVLTFWLTTYLFGSPVAAHQLLALENLVRLLVSSGLCYAIDIWGPLKALL